MNMNTEAGSRAFRQSVQALNTAYDRLGMISGALNGLRDALEARSGNGVIDRESLSMLFYTIDAGNLPEGVDNESVGEARAAIIDLIGPEADLNGVSRVRVWSLVCLLAKLQEVAVHQLGEIVHGHPALDA
ncbi:TPA: hypothetical protein ACXI1H_000527 [Stenotrophomonas maltophilia]